MTGGKKATVTNTVLDKICVCIQQVFPDSSFAVIYSPKIPQNGDEWVQWHEGESIE